MSGEVEGTPGIYPSRDTSTDQYLNLVHIYMFILIVCSSFSIHNKVHTGGDMDGEGRDWFGVDLNVQIGSGHPNQLGVVYIVMLR